ncbi:hypothetical protein OK074_8249 [Actinobacteria bacterium OK074]|nr:hypothetical protein OK074_8249 [Actinobacteria bacterium OK074]
MSRCAGKRVWFAAGTATVAAVGALTAVALTGVGAPGAGGPGGEGGRPVSGAEAQRMALARFRTYQQSPAEVTIRVPSTGTETVTVRAIVDHRLHRAVGTFETATARGVIAWDQGGIAVTDASAKAPSRTPQQALRRAAALKPDRWTRRPYTPAPLDRALRLLLSLSANRPDNAQLLAQSGPLWLREDRIGGREYGVFSGPRPRPNGTQSPTTSASGRSPLAYWIDGEGELRRVTAEVTPGRTVTIDVVRRHVYWKLPDAPWRLKGRGR